MKPKKQKNPKVTGSGLGSRSTGIDLSLSVSKRLDLTVDECSHHVSYLLEIFTRIVSENERISPRKALRILLTKAQERFNENYPAVFGDLDKTFAPLPRDGSRKEPWLIYTNFEGDKRRH